MKMQILKIVLYHQDGRTREVTFTLGSVNIITGNSNTGKSTIIDIVEYCLGNKDFNVRLRRSVSGNIACFAVVYQLADRQVFIAKRVPVNAKSRSTLFLLEGQVITPPSLADIEDNSNDDELKVYLGRLIGIPENEIEPGKGIPSYGANIRHTVFYLFQKNADVIDESLLFYKQGVNQNDRTIRDTLPVLLGAVKPDYMQLRQQLRQKRREMMILQKEVEEASDIQMKGVSLVPILLLEAQQLGLISQDVNVNEVEDGRALLASLLEGGIIAADISNGSSSNQIDTTRQRIERLRDTYTIQQAKIAQYQQYELDATGYSSAVREHASRLEMAELFEDNSSPSSNQEDICPVCGSELRIPNPEVETLRRSLDDIRSQLSRVEVKRPALTKVIDSLQRQALQTRQEIRQAELELEAIITQGQYETQSTSSGDRLLDFLGGVKMFFRLAPRQQDALREMQQQLEVLRSECSELEAAIEDAEGADRLDVIIHEISQYMTQFASQIGEEYRNGIFTFNLAKLTVFISHRGDFREFGRNVGSDKNQLQIHLVLYLALHKFFAQNNSPVPSFLIIDQVDKPFYPDDTAYESVTNPEDLMRDPDRMALLEIFRVFQDVCRDLAGNLQIIALQHANFPDQSYQSSVMENWRNGNALVPQDWIDEAFYDEDST